MRARCPEGRHGAVQEALQGQRAGSCVRALLNSAHTELILETCLADCPEGRHGVVQTAQQGQRAGSRAGAVVHGAAALRGAAETPAPAGTPAGQRSRCARACAAPGGCPGVLIDIRRTLYPEGKHRTTDSHMVYLCGGRSLLQIRERMTSSMCSGFLEHMVEQHVCTWL